MSSESSLISTTVGSKNLPVLRVATTVVGSAMISPWRKMATWETPL